MKLRGEDVSSAIRKPDVSQGASKVSAVPEVREALLDMQRQAGAAGGAVLEGRDIGTVVFPNAEAKFFLTASVDVRARRRYDELVSRGASPLLEEVQREVAERDLRDSTRPIAPLKQARTRSSSIVRAFRSSRSWSASSRACAKWKQSSARADDARSVLLAALATLAGRAAWPRLPSEPNRSAAQRA